METALLIMAIQGTVSLLQTQMKLAAEHARTRGEQERQAIHAAMQLEWLKAEEANATLKQTFVAHGVGQ